MGAGGYVIERERLQGRFVSLYNRAIDIFTGCFEAAINSAFQEFPLRFGNEGVKNVLLGDVKVHLMITATS